MGSIKINNKIILLNNNIVEIDEIRNSNPIELIDFDFNSSLCFFNCNVHLNLKNKFIIINGNDMHKLRNEFEKLEDAIFNFIYQNRSHYDYFFIESTGLALSEVIKLKENVVKLVLLNINVFYFIFKVKYVKFELKKI
jgi:hypothetical protein